MSFQYQWDKETFEEKLDKTIKITVRAYTNKLECSVEEAVYHILTKLHLPKTFLGVSFANIFAIIHREEQKF